MSTKPEYKIIADHLRSSSFLVADGVLPSNEGRGYVLRRIMRRAMRQLHKLGAREASMYKLVDPLIHEMGQAYPELSRARAVIVETLKNEEEKFRETLEKGLKILEEEITKIPLSGWNQPSAENALELRSLPGSVAFKLYDTYGFPLDLTQDILKEKQLFVDVDGFNKEMELQRERAKANWKGSGEEKEDAQFLELKNKLGATKFLGYEKLEEKARVIAVTPSAVVLDHTPFYATSGGQKGDDGKIFLSSDKTKFVEISETKKFGGALFVHFIDAEKSNYNFKIGDEVIAQVNAKNRAKRARNHSATHLMHKALKEILGNSVSQKGSNVDADYFTFDFNFNRAMTPDEKQKTEDFVNKYIKQASPVQTAIMPLEEAHKSGAEALFGEKYEADVRVVSMSPSVELCGGTHVKNTAEIEVFKLVSENGIAAGIRRIKAVTGFEEVKKLQDQEAQKILEEKEKLAQKEKEKELEKEKRKKLFASLGELRSEKIGDLEALRLSLLVHQFDDAEAKDLREIALDLKARKEFFDSHIFALFGTKEDKVAVCVALSNNLLYKFDATKLIIPLIEAVGGKGGGGKKDLAMGGGTNKDGVAQAIELVKKLIK